MGSKSDVEPKMKCFSPKLQDRREKYDRNARKPVQRGQIDCRSVSGVKNIRLFRLNLSTSVDVLLEATRLLQFADEGDRLVRRSRAELRDDVDQRPLHILRHALGVATDVEMRAIGQP